MARMLRRRGHGWEQVNFDAPPGLRERFQRWARMQGKEGGPVLVSFMARSVDAEKWLEIVVPAQNAEAVTRYARVLDGPRNSNVESLLTAITTILQTIEAQQRRKSNE